MYGQLGNGSTGEYIEKAGKVHFSCEFTPFHVRTFLRKDGHGRVNNEYSSDTIKVMKVEAGKNHSACLTDESSGSRMFTWGFGGYGRLGHRCAEGLILIFSTSY